MEKREPLLVTFTVLSQMSVGITLILTLHVLQGKLESKCLCWLVNGLVLAVASVVAILHLAHPNRAYDALANLQHVWSSREILSATLCGTAVGVTFLVKGHRALAALASALGIALVAVQGVTYAALAMVAIVNGLTMLLFSITVWVMGRAAIPLPNLVPAVAALRQGIAVCMTVMIVASIIWLSGGTIMQMTAHAWLMPPLCLASLVCLVVAFVLSRQGERRAKAPSTPLFIGVFLSRLMSLSDAISSIVNISHLY